MNDNVRKQTIDIDTVLENIQRFTVETPSWGYSDSGTRFKVFHWPGAARTLREKLADAAEVQKVTGICPSVAIHIPWDKEDDWQAVKEYATALGLRIGAVNPNLFQDDLYRLGSLCHVDKAVRAADRAFDCGALQTRMPRAVAASTSTLSTPVPARPITRSCVPAAISSASTRVAERTTSAS